MSKKISKCVILAGGLGTRISEESATKPKPMIEVGGKPILWHIMKIYSHFGINDFIVCCGYKGYVIKEYFKNYVIHNSDITLDFKDESIEVHDNKTESWKVTLIDTGENTLTGGRLKRVKQYIGDDDFCFTYGDGLANINVKSLIAHHIKMNKLATISAVTQPGRFGALKLNNQMVEDFLEKPEKTDNYINGGFFVLSPKVIDYIDGDSTIWERDPLERLAKNNELTAYHHNGFWQPMDTLRDKNYLEELWGNDKALWKIW